MSDWRNLPSLWIWNSIRANAPASMADLVHHLGWAPETILALLPALGEAGLIVEQADGLVPGPRNPFEGLETQDPAAPLTADETRELYVSLIARGAVENAKGGNDRPTRTGKRVVRHRPRFHTTLPGWLIERARRVAALNDYASLAELIETLLVAFCDVPIRWTAADLAAYSMTITVREPEAPTAA